MLDSNYVGELGDWIAASLAEINSQMAAVETLDDVKIAKRRIKLFLEELEQKKREINLHIKEVRNQFDQQEPSKGFFSKRTRKDIDNERDRAILPWKKATVIIDKQIGEMKRFQYEIDKQVKEQTQESAE